MIKVFEAFAGYGSQAMALKRLKENYPGFNYEVVGISEIDKYAIKAYNAVHGETKNFGDISKIDWDNVPDFDLFTYSFPCFIKGTLILTNKGYKKIEDISIEDKVLTHTNSFKKVLQPMVKPYCGNLYTINAMCFHTLQCTEEHPFYVREKYRYGHKSVRMFKDPEWVKAKDLSNKYYLGYAVNQNSELPSWNGVIDNTWGHKKIKNTLSPLFSNKVFWYIMGRYVGDGWKKNSKSGSGIVICCSDRNRESLIDALNNIGWNFNLVSERTVDKIFISSNECNVFVDRFGCKAEGKKVDFETLSLPTDLLEGFMNGIIDSDGCFTNNRFKVTSVSKQLVYGLAQCIAKVYHRPFAIYKTKRSPTTVIEGRIVNQKDTYTVVWSKEKAKQDKAFYENGYVWFPIKEISVSNFTGIVYNMSVEEDESYTANGCIVHNCTDISSAGLQKGLAEGSGTRSSLLWECKKAIEAKKPKYLLMENVKALTQKKFLPYLHEWERYLGSLGYTNFTKVLNAKNYGVPQNRERVFMVSVLGDAWYEFPKPFELTKRLKDVLEKDVDEKYYLSKKMVDCFRKRTEVAIEKGNGFRFKPTDDNFIKEFYGNKRVQTLVDSGKISGNDIGFLDAYNQSVSDVCGTIKTTINSSNMSFISEPTIQKVGNYSKSGHNASTIVSGEGISPTVMENHGTVTAAVEPNVVQIGNLFSDRDNFSNPQEGRIYDKEGLSPSLLTMQGGNKQPKIETEKYRIRKLTERECFRLMGVLDSDIDKIQSAGISKTQQYKLAGNSIVVNVLYHIFRKLFISSPYGFHVLEEV